MRRIVTTLIISCALLATPLIPSSAQAGVGRIRRVAVVDLERVINDTTQGKQATKRLEKTLTRDTAKLQRKEKEMLKKFEDLKAKSAVLSEAELQRRAMELQEEQQALMQLGQQAQASLEQDQATLAEKMYRNVETVVKRMAAAEGIQLVLVRSDATMLYANPKLDITNKVIVAYDKKFK